MLTGNEWNTFFELLEKMVHAERPVEEKERKLVQAAQEHNAEDNLQELFNWNIQGEQETEEV